MPSLNATTGDSREAIVTRLLILWWCIFRSIKLNGLLLSLIDIPIDSNGEWWQTELAGHLWGRTISRWMTSLAQSVCCRVGERPTRYSSDNNKIVKSRLEIQMRRGGQWRRGSRISFPPIYSHAQTRDKTDGRTNERTSAQPSVCVDFKRIQWRENKIKKESLKERDRTFPPLVPD